MIKYINPGPRFQIFSSILDPWGQKNTGSRIRNTGSGGMIRIRSTACVEDEGGEEERIMVNQAEELLAYSSL
jgi:hypothetical protein